jgi:hypothetical protein
MRSPQTNALRRHTNAAAAAGPSVIDRNSVDAIQSDYLKEHNSAQNASCFTKKRQLESMNAVLIALVLVGPNRDDLIS